MPYQWKQHAEFDDGAVANGGIINKIFFKFVSHIVISQDTLHCVSTISHQVTNQS